LIDKSKAMQRAIEISELGLGLTTPNPIVGALVIDDSGEILGEGFHNCARDKNHAEVNALNVAGKRAQGAILVSTLEPCNHTGKTPPCVDAISRAGIKQVIYSIKDPNPIAQGGADRLRSLGIKVIEGVLEKEVRFSNRAWLTKIEKKRPYISIKSALSLDGKMAAADGSSKWITNEHSRNDVARLRSECDAIVTGTGTVFADDPSLTVRDIDRLGAKFVPTRLVLGKRLIPKESKLLDNTAPTIHLQTDELSQLIELARCKRWNRILIEAGPTLTGAFLKAGLFDEIFLYQAPTILGGNFDFAKNLGLQNISDRLDLQLHEVALLGDIQKNLRLHLLALRS
jgi:diaminohydroxyphosphoribosylaminopyrimidine deaminase/5-amino-6-(5-phosphoribosylamino)uracil reductase